MTFKMNSTGNNSDLGEEEVFCRVSGLVFMSLHGHCVTVQDIIINIVIFLIGMLIIAINLWMLRVLISRGDKDDASQKILVHLSSADSLIGLFLMYDSTYNILQYKIYTECVLRVGLFTAVNLASVLTLLILTFDRFVKLYAPYTYIKYITLKRINVMEAFAWLLSIVVGSLPFFGWSTEDILHICDYFYIMEESYIILILVLFTLPFLTMVVVYSTIIRLVIKHKDFICSLRIQNVGKIQKTVKTSGIIVGAYFGCWMPVGIFTILTITTDVKKSLPSAWSENVIFTYLLCLGIFNSILNPIIYYKNIGVVRKAARKLCCFKSCLKKKTFSSSKLSNTKSRSSLLQSNLEVRSIKKTTTFGSIEERDGSVQGTPDANN